MSLTEKQKLFIKYYIETGKPKRSAVLAGYSEGNASKAAREMLKENVHVMRALRDIREAKDAPKKEYDLAAAMAEADEAYIIAKSTENPTAMLGAAKLKAQLMKILDDRPVGAAFQIVFSGIDDQKTVVSVVQPAVKALTGDLDEP